MSSTWLGHSCVCMQGVILVAILIRIPGPPTSWAHVNHMSELLFASPPFSQVKKRRPLEKGGGMHAEQGVKGTEA